MMRRGAEPPAVRVIPCDVQQATEASAGERLNELYSRLLAQGPRAKSHPRVNRHIPWVVRGHVPVRGHWHVLVRLVTSSCEVTCSCEVTSPC